MQDTAKTWLILGLKGSSATSIGGLMFAHALPNFLFLPVAGGLSDKFGPRVVLLFTQTALALTSLMLGIFVTTGQINYTCLLILAFIEGCAVAFDVPAFNLVTPRLVERSQFQQALALNSVSFHMSRAVGPALAGMAMAYLGHSSAFYFNALSFLLIVAVLSRLALGGPTTQREAKKDSGTLKEVVLFLRHHPLFFRIMVQFVLVMCLLFPIIFTTLRVLVKDRLGLGSHEFGLFMALPGLGALTGSLTFLIMKPKNPYQVLPFGLAGIVSFLIIIAESYNRTALALSIGCFSFCMFLTLSALLVTVQLKVDDAIRGRVSSLIGFSFVAISPVMSVPIGWGSDAVGPRAMIWIVSLLFGMLTLGLYQYTQKNVPKES